jgi:hypothetical protein
MNTALDLFSTIKEILYIEYEGHILAYWVYFNEDCVRAYCDGHYCETINLEVKGYENKRSEDNISQRQGIGQPREAPV